MADLRVTLAGMKLENPLIPASGVFGYGADYLDFFDPNILGSFVTKGTTREPRFGNPLPRVAECPAGMLNAVGLQNPGVMAVLENELPKLRTFYRKQCIANVSGFSVEEYAETAALLEKDPSVGALEVNISCPNVKHGGMAFGTDPTQAAAVTAAVKKAVEKPVFIKLSPNVTDIAAMAVACEEAGADGISLINTLLGMRIDLRARRPVLANTFGGYSGPGVFPVALRMVYQVYNAVNIPIMGMGGITCARDVVEMLLAGATAVQIGGENLRDPLACPRILAELPELLDEMHVDKLSDLIGGAHGCV
ncbi:MAG: dihydroorotate dehydrogenase [Christensenellales bacterium]|jgi:dihydroorotate dehydrogenase (NAD+) catalytic subunit